jgi:hypothetical protein
MNRDAEDNRAAFCPSCERFIGPADVCPYCDADSARPPILRVLRWMAFVLAVGGLVFLYAAAKAREVSVVEISHITPMMNFAQVQIAGTVQKDAYVGRTNGVVDYVSFIINDGSGELRVVAYNNIARNLEKKSLIPRKGDVVEANGSISATADNKPKLRIISAEKLRIRERKTESADQSGDDHGAAKPQ